VAEERLSRTSVFYFTSVTSIYSIETMASEGSREIDTAKQRLAIARAQKSSASKMIDSANSLAKSASEMKESARNMAAVAAITKESANKMADTAKKNKEAAQSQLQSTQSEVEAAEAFLKEAEQRWEVIDVDADATPQNDKGRKRRRRTPETARATENTLQLNDSSVNGENAVQSGASGNGGSVQTAAATDRSSNENGDSRNFYEIEVEGSGMSEVDGTYKKAADTYGFVCFAKQGQWNGKAANFVIYRKSNYWYICFCGGTLGGAFLYPVSNFFRTMSGRADADFPPGNGWMTVGNGISPAPKLTWYHSALDS